MQLEESKPSTVEQVTPDLVEEDMAVDQGVALPVEEAKQIMNKAQDIAEDRVTDPTVDLVEEKTTGSDGTEKEADSGELSEVTINVEEEEEERQRKVGKLGEAALKVTTGEHDTDASDLSEAAPKVTTGEQDIDVSDSSEIVPKVLEDEQNTEASDLSERIPKVAEKEEPVTEAKELNGTAVKIIEDEPIAEAKDLNETTFKINEEEQKVEVEESNETASKIIDDEPIAEAKELNETILNILEDQQKVEGAADVQTVVAASSLLDESDDSDDNTEKALSETGSVKRQSLKVDTDFENQQEDATDTPVDDSTWPVTGRLTTSPLPQTPTTPDNVRMSDASMTSVRLSETDMSYDHLSAEQVEDFLATPRNHGSRHIRRPSSYEILQNSWEPGRQSTLFDANSLSTPVTPEISQGEIMGAEQSTAAGSQDRGSSNKKSVASSIASTTRGSQSSEEEANEVDWSQLERHEWQEKSDKDIPEGAEDDSTAFLLARLEQENALLTSDPKAATHKHVKRARGKSRPPSMAQLRKLVTQTDTPSIRYSLAPTLEYEEPPQMTELEFWTALVQDYPSTAARLPTLTTSKIRAGIPPPLRGIVWASMAGARDRSLEDAFERLADEKSPYEGIINKDVGRSFPGVDLFRDAGGDGQKMLGRVLKCFSLHDKEIGYCQGLGFLVGPLLMNMGEREAFCTLVRLMDHYSLQPSFLPSLRGLHMRIYQFSALLKQLYPALAEHLTVMGVEPAYLSQWFLSCFAVTCPLPMLFRMYDVIFAEGANETVMRVALAIMRRNEQKLLASTEFEEVMHLLLGRTVFDSYGCNADELVDDFTSLDDVITHARLAELEREFEAQSGGAVGEKAGFLPDVQAAASRFLGRLWAPSHSASKSTVTLSPNTAEKTGGILRRSTSKHSISTLNESNDGNSSGVVSLASTAPTDTDMDISRESMADTMSFRSKADSVRTQSAIPQPGLSKEDRDMHSQIEDLLTALSEMQREHAQLTAMLQKEREDRNDDHRVVRQLVDRLQKGEEETTSTVEDRRRTLPPPPRNPNHVRQLSQPVKPLNGPKHELNDLLERVSGRLEVNSRFSTSLETKAQLRNTLSLAREQLASEESRSRDLVATVASFQAESEDLRSEVSELRGRVSEDFKERQRLEHTVRELQAQARVVERRELLSRTDSGNDGPTPSRSDSNDANRRMSTHLGNSSSSGLRELKLGRRESSSSVPSLRTVRTNSQTRQASAPQAAPVTPPDNNVGFGNRTSSLLAQVPLEAAPDPGADEALLLELVNAKTSEAQARQEVDELRRNLAVLRRKQDEERRTQEETLQRALAEIETTKAENAAWRSADSQGKPPPVINSEKSLPGTPGEESGGGGVSLSLTGPETPEKDAKPATTASTVGGWFWGRRTASTSTAKLLSP